MKKLLINLLCLSTLSVFAQERDYGDRAGRGDDRDDTPSVSISGYIGNMSTLSSAESANLAVSSVSKDALLKEFRFRPEIAVNKNTGNLKAGFSIPMPANLTPLSKLHFSYNSKNQRNTGLGVGWSLDLPFIEINKASDELKINGQKLVEVKSPSITSRLEAALKYYNLSAKETKTYRKEIETNFSLIVELKGYESNYLEFFLDGKDNLYNAQGQLVSTKDAFNNELTLSWENGVLKNLRASSFAAKFDYENRDSKMSYYKNSFYNLPEKLNSIELRVGGEKRKVLFSYSDNLLTHVKWQDGIKSIFIGEYKTQKKNKIHISSLAINKDQVVVPGVLGENSIQSAKSGDTSFLYLDLNGDNHLDRITIDGGYISRRLRGYAKKLEKRDWTFSKYKDAVRSFIRKRPTITFSKVEMAIIKNEKKYYVEDKSLNPSLALGLHPYNLILSEKDGNVDVRTSIKHGTYFVDINGDGKKDFIYCAGSVNKDSDLLSHYDALMRVNKKISGSLAKSFWTLGGSSAQVYLQEYNIADIERNYFHGEVSEPENFVANSSQWRKVNHLSFRCSEKSIWNDFNQDGYVDVLTGKTIYYLSPNAVVTKNITESELINLITIDEDLPKTNKYKDWSLTPIKNTEKLKLQKLKQMVVNPKTLELSEITAAGEYKTQMTTKYPILVSAKSDFGGEYRVNYKSLNGSWVVANKVIDPKDPAQPKTTMVFNYESSLVDPFKGIINGYSKVKTNYDYGTPLRLNNATIEIYSIDSPKIVLFMDARARLNGKKVQTDSLDQNGFAYKSTYYKWKIFQKEKIIHPYIEMTETFHRVAQMPQGYKKRDYTKTQIELNDAFIPKRIEATSKEITGLVDIYGAADALSMNNKVIVKSFNSKNYRSIVTSETSSSEDSSYMKTYEYNHKFKPTKISHQDEFIKLSYDDLGRLSRIQDHTSNFKAYNYISNTRLPSLLTDTENTTRFDYDLFLSKSISTEKNGAQLLNFYSTDGILTSTKRKACLTCESIELMSKSVNFDRRVVTISQFGKNQEYFFDGLGRISHELIPFTKPVVSGKRIFDSSDNVLEVSFPNSNELLEQNRFDARNRLVQKNSYSNTLMLEHNINCHKESLNGVFQKEACRRNDGKLVSLKEKTGRYKYKYDVLNKLLSVTQSQKELFYERDTSSELLSSYFVNEEAEFMSYNFEYDKVNRKTTIENAKIISLTPAAKVESVITSRGNDVSYTYSKGHVTSKEIHNENDKQLNQYEYNNLGLVTAANSQGIKQKLTYNEFDQLVHSHTSAKEVSVSVDYSYDYTRLQSITPFITNIEYDDFGRLLAVEYADSQTLKIQYNEEKVAALSLAQDNINYSYNQENKVASISYNNQRVAVDYHKGQITSSPKVKWSKFDDYGRVTKIDGMSLEWALTELIKVNDLRLGYEDQSLKMACGSDCFHVLSSHLLKYKDNVIQKVVVANKTVGVIVNNKFYAVLTDLLGSIIAVYDNNTKVIARSYDLWGNKTSQVQNGYEDVEKLIAWSFAGLIEPPQLSGKGLYWSQSRVYSAKLKHWLSIDPAVMYYPEKLTSSTQDWNGVLYCNGDPVNNVDPSGHYVKQIGKYSGAVLQESMTTFGPGDVVGSVIGGAIGTGVGATVGFAYGGPIGAEVGGTLGSLVGGVIGGAIGGLFDNPGIDPNEDAKVFERNSKAKSDAMLKDMGIKKEDIELDFNSRTLELNMDFQDNSGPQLKQDNSFNTQVY